MVKTNTKALLNKYLKELFLSTMRQCYEDLANQAMQESLSYDQYLLALTELECITRQNNRIERNLHIPLNLATDSGITQPPIPVTLGHLIRANSAS